MGNDTPEVECVQPALDPASVAAVAASFDSFWRDIVMPGGVLDLEQVKRELHDYHVLLEEVPKVYCQITGGRISKPNTLASEVLAVHEAICRADV